MKLKFNDLVEHRIDRTQYRVICDQGETADVATVENGITVIVKKFKKSLLKKVAEAYARKGVKELKLNRKDGGVEIEVEVGKSVVKKKPETRRGIISVSSQLIDEVMSSLGYRIGSVGGGTVEYEGSTFLSDEVLVRAIAQKIAEKIEVIS